MERFLLAQLCRGGKEVRGLVSFRSHGCFFPIIHGTSHKCQRSLSSVLIYALTTERPRQDAVSVCHGSKEKKTGMCLLKSYKSVLTAGK